MAPDDFNSKNTPTIKNNPSYLCKSKISYDDFYKKRKIFENVKTEKYDIPDKTNNNPITEYYIKMSR
jgi:hypothetical protein